MLTMRFLKLIEGRGLVFLAVLTALMLLVPIGNLAFPPGSPFHISTGTVVLLGKYLTYAMLAVALDLAWGYCGILSLGMARSSRSAATPWACISCGRSGRAASMATRCCRISWSS